MPEVTWNRHSDTELRTTIAGRQYAIYRRQFPGGLRYYAWCEWRGEFAQSGYVAVADREQRVSVTEDLKAECHYDVFVGGISSWNWQ